MGKNLAFALCTLMVAPCLVAQDQPVTRAAFEASTPEGFTAVTLTLDGTVYGAPERYTSDSAIGGVAYMLLGELKGCDFANAELDRGSKVYIKTQRLGFSSGYETHTTCRKTSIQYRSQWLGYRMTHLLFFDDDEADNAGEVLYDETAEEYRLDGMSEVTETHFEEGSSTERFIAENSFGGVNVGPPVAATGPGPLTYTMTGTDAASFAVIEDTGQIRTKDGVTYDYETKPRYFVDLLAKADDSEDMIAVTINIQDQLSPCVNWHDFRAIAGDKNVFVRWVTLDDAEGYAYIQGYEVEMRLESDGVWGSRRTLLGRTIPGTIYTDLVNDQDYKFRIRAIHAEGDCDWEESGVVTPVALQRAPRDEEEHFLRVGRQEIGTNEKNYRFLTLNRCRHTTDGTTLDATCTYENTGSSSGTITLEFDDPAKSGCEVSLAYSSLTAGSFHGQCFGAGVNVGFDTSFQLPPLPDDEEQTPSSLPRSQAEFNVLAWGRDDLIPGLGFSCLPGIPDCDFAPGRAYRIERDSTSRTITYTAGFYTYERNDSGQGILRFEGADGKTFVFTLEAGPSMRIRASVAGADDSLTGWPGMPDTLLEGSSLPVLLPIPPSWSAAIEIETDVAPEDIDGFEARIPTPADPETPEAPRLGLFQSHLLGETWDQAFIGPDGEDSLAIAHNYSYSKIGRNRATVTFTWQRSPLGAGTELTPFQQYLLESTWVFDIRFHTEDSGTSELTITRDGDAPIKIHQFLDLKAGTSITDSFPEELALPDDPPQDSGEDISGVQIAPITSIESIGENDLQTFLVHNPGTQPVSYSAGDWLEPKDGGNQRMMVVAASQAAGSGVAAQSKPIKTTAPAIADVFDDFEQSNTFRSLDTLLPRNQSHDPALTQISVVCMQLDREVPPRGARYFSKPKEAEGAVQECQENCAIAGGENTQVCVWNCETDLIPPSTTTDDPYQPFEGFRISSGRVQIGFFSAGGCINLTNTAINGVTYTIHNSHWQRRDDDAAPWADISGTEHEGGACAYSPTEPGQYRAVGELSVNGERGKYSSENILTIP